jgi:hypothetical protein
MIQSLVYVALNFFSFGGGGQANRWNPLQRSFLVWRTIKRLGDWVLSTDDLLVFCRLLHNWLPIISC